MKIGSHVGNSGDGMLLNSVKEALSYKANSFMVYLGPPQSTMRKDASRLNINEMRELMKLNNLNIEDVIIHAPYIVNLAQPNPEKRKFAVDFITQEMKTMAKVGCKYMVVHPGAHMGEGIEKGIERIADSFKRILENTNNDDTYIAIETMAGKGSECCSKFEEIAEIMKIVNSDRLVVCFDTCHTNDAGYDIVNDYDNVLNHFDNVIGLDKIKVIHLNDSLNERGRHKDRHANIGLGKVGFNTIIKFANDERFINIPKILETPYVKDEKDSYPPYYFEIEMIKSGKFDEDLISKILNNYK